MKTTALLVVALAGKKGQSINSLMEHHALKKIKQLYEYQHLPLLRDTWGLYHKTYYGRNLQISVISVCPWQAFPA
jgi:hypothetical protein